MKSNRRGIVLYYEIVVGGRVADPLAARIGSETRFYEQTNEQRRDRSGNRERRAISNHRLATTKSDAYW